MRGRGPKEAIRSFDRILDVEMSSVLDRQGLRMLWGRVAGWPLYYVHMGRCIFDIIQTSSNMPSMLLSVAFCEPVSHHDEISAAFRCARKERLCWVYCVGFSRIRASLRV